EDRQRRLTNVQRMRMVEDTLDNEIRPAVRKDGGDVELVDVVGTKVQIAFRGNCAWCRTREFTADGFIGQKLRDQVDPDITVEDVSETLDRKSGRSV
ncbi:MAG: NifU family protein, partial [Planctomycetota bacterium]